MGVERRNMSRICVFMPGYTGNPYFLVKKVAKKHWQSQYLGGLQGPRITGRPEGLPISLELILILIK